MTSKDLTRRTHGPQFQSIGSSLRSLLLHRAGYLRLPNAKRKVRARPARDSAPVVRFLYREQRIENIHSMPLNDPERDEIDGMVKKFIQKTMKDIEEYKTGNEYAGLDTRGELLEI